MKERVYEKLASLEWPMEPDLFCFAFRDDDPAAVLKALEDLAREGRAQCDEDGWRIAKPKEAKKPKQMEMFV